MSDEIIKAGNLRISREELNSLLEKRRSINRVSRVNKVSICGTCGRTKESEVNE